MAICSVMDKVSVQEALYYANAKVPPLENATKDEDGVPMYCLEGEAEADTLVSIDIGVSDVYLVSVERSGDFETVYEGDSLADALEAYRKVAVETTLPL